jgi:hypothetical protein
MKPITRNPATKFLLLVTVYCLLITLIGCDAFVRKFTRKSKRDAKEKQELVLAPEEYKPAFANKEEAYRQYFLYWKSWHDELINSLSGIGTISNKKQVDCVNETIKNLEDMKKILKETKQKELDVYIKQLNDLKDAIKQDSYGRSLTMNRMAAERIKRYILRDFSYDKVKESMA